GWGCSTSILSFPAADGIRDRNVTGVQTCALPIYQQAVDIHAARLGVNRVERVLRVDKRGRTAHFLRLCHAVQRNCGLTGGLRPRSEERRVGEEGGRVRWSGESHTTCGPCARKQHE